MDRAMRKDSITAIDAFRWLLPQDSEAGMRVPGIILSSKAGMEKLRMEEALQQVANVASLPGILKYSLAMPDIHWGYGFPIGGVAATDAQTGVISPGGVGYDINCGVRLIRTNLLAVDIAKYIPALLNSLFGRIPAGSTKRIT